MTTTNATPTPGKIALPPRTAARVATVQGLYQMDLAGTDLNDVIEEFTLLRFPRAPGDEAAAGADPAFFAELIRGVVRRQRDIDPWSTNNSPRAGASFALTPSCVPSCAPACSS